MDIKPAGKPEQSCCREKSKSRVLRMLVRKFPYKVNDTLSPSDVTQIRDPKDSEVLTVAHIVIGLSLHIHSFIHLSFCQRSKVYVFLQMALGVGGQISLYWTDVLAGNPVSI